MAAINLDPQVARYLNRPAGDEFLGLVTDHWNRHGFGFWALESRESRAAGALLGFAGVAFVEYIPALAGRPELGWRLAPWAWGRGLAFEAALAAREHATTRLGLRGLGMRVERQIHNPCLERQVDVWS